MTRGITTQGTIPIGKDDTSAFMTFRIMTLGIMAFSQIRQPQS
jgi:hypothetical protein